MEYNTHNYFIIVVVASREPKPHSNICMPDDLGCYSFSEFSYLSVMLLVGYRRVIELPVISIYVRGGGTVQVPTVIPWGRLSACSCHLGDCGGWHFCLNHGGSNHVIIGIGSSVSTFLHDETFTEFDTRAVTDLMPFLMAIRAGQFALAMLMLFTLITFPTLPAFTFFVAMSFGISFCEEWGVTAEGFLRLHHGLFLDRLDCNLIMSLYCSHVMVHHQFQNIQPIIISLYSVQEIELILIVDHLDQCPGEILGQWFGIEIVIFTFWSSQRVSVSLLLHFSCHIPETSFHLCQTSNLICALYALTNSYQSVCASPICIYDMCSHGSMLSRIVNFAVPCDFAQCLTAARSTNLSIVVASSPWSLGLSFSPMAIPLISFWLKRNAICHDHCL